MIIKLDKKITTLFLLLIMFFALLIRLPFLNVPLERDEGEYAYIAQRIEHGDIPYKDAFNQKPPGIFYIYWLAFQTLGEKVRDIHLFMYLFTLIEIFLIYKLGSILFNKSIGLISAGIFSFITIEPGVCGNAANTEIFMLLPIIASIVVLLLAIQKKKLGLFFICGVLNGIAFMIKQVAVFNFLFIIIFMLHHSLKDENNFKSLIKRYQYLIFGFVMVLVPIFLYFWLKNAWGDFLYCVFLHNFAYITTPLSNHLFSKFWERIYPILAGDWVFWILSLYAFSYLLRTKKLNNPLLPGWFIFSFLGVVVSPRFFPHYFLQLTPALAIGAGWGLYKVIQGINKVKSVSLRKLIFIIVIGMIVIVPLNVNYKYIFVYSPDEISMQIYGSSPFVEAKPVADYIAQNSSENDTIAVIGSEPEILFYAKRRSATKYIIFYPLTGDYKDSLVKQKQAFQEITTNNPRYIVIINEFSSLLVKGYTKRYIFEEIGKIIKNDYYLDGFVLIRKDNSEYIFGYNRVKLFCEYTKDRDLILLYRRKEG